jgi:hypothetical protein
MIQGREDEGIRTHLRRHSRAIRDGAHRAEVILTIVETGSCPLCPIVVHKPFSLGPERPPRPTIVCLVGSTRFYQQFREVNYLETLAGRIVLSIGFYPHDDQPHGQNNGITPEQKLAVDALHLRKVELADEVYIINVGQYIGESTQREIAHAERLGKRLRWHEEPRARASTS